MKDARRKAMAHAKKYKRSNNVPAPKNNNLEENSEQRMKEIKLLKNEEENPNTENKIGKSIIQKRNSIKTNFRQNSPSNISKVEENALSEKEGEKSLTFSNKGNNLEQNLEEQTKSTDNKDSEDFRGALNQKDPKSSNTNNKELEEDLSEETVPSKLAPISQNGFLEL